MLLIKMEIETFFNKCILCVDGPPGDPEHIIPKSIGGRLKAKILCNKCNNTLGSIYMSKIKSDPSIRLCINNLRNLIPSLYESLEYGQKYFTKDDKDTSTEFEFNKKFGLRVVEKKKKDGSLIRDTNKYINDVIKSPKKHGLSKINASNKMCMFEKLSSENMFELTDDTKIIKRNINIKSLRQDLNGPFLDNKTGLVMAYEFLSLVIGKNIYDSNYNSIREFIINKDKAQPKNIDIKNGSWRQYRPYHCIFAKQLDGKVQIRIILFWNYIFDVYFKNNNLTNCNGVYCEDLLNKKSLVSPSVDDANNGNFSDVTNYNNIDKSNFRAEARYQK